MLLTRRLWFSRCASLTAIAQIAAAQKHARQAVQSETPPRFEILDSDTAAEIEALVSQIIPSTNGPGAREAGAVYFIDRALSTFDADEREAYRTGLSSLQEQRRRLFPASTTIAGLSAAQQTELLRTIENSDFFELLRTHTLLGFLGDPSYGGNRDHIGWKFIGFDDRMAFEPPFGYYDAQSFGHKE